MLRDSVFEQDHINAVVKVFVLLTRWSLPLQFVARMLFAGINKVHAVLHHDGAAGISSLLQFEGYGGQRRQMNQDRMFAAHPFAGFALNAA